MSLEDVVSAALPAVVLVQTTDARGTGFFVSSDTVVTNCAMVRPLAATLPVRKRPEPHGAGPVRPGGGGNGGGGPPRPAAAACAAFVSAMVAWQSAGVAFSSGPSRRSVR
jgi:hypothetical protein